MNKKITILALATIFASATNLLKSSDITSRRGERETIGRIELLARLRASYPSTRARQNKFAKQKPVYSPKGNASRFMRQQQPKCQKQARRGN